MSWQGHSEMDNVDFVILLSLQLIDLNNDIFYTFLTLFIPCFGD